MDLESSGDRSYRAVKSEFSHDEEVVQIRQTPLSGCSDDAECNREVVSTAFLVHVSGGKIDYNLLSRDTEIH